MDDERRAQCVTAGVLTAGRLPASRAGTEPVSTDLPPSRAARAIGEIGVDAIGARARAALERGGRRAEPLAAFPSSPYLRAGGELIWVSHRLPAAHPRAVRVASPPPAAGEGRGSVRFGALPAPDVRACALPAATGAGLARARAACAALAAAPDAIGAPRGLGVLLVGRTPPFPLEAAVPQVDALGAALAAGDAGAAARAAYPLLGLGPGLTPSGDDFVGAALCVRLFAARVEGRQAAWQAAAARLVAAAPARTNEVSATLFGDLVAGETYAPLAALLRALAAGDCHGARGAARALAALGHSSGWDMLAGCVLGLTGGLGRHARTNEGVGSRG
ncbi:MAG: DUF2877 domain-containing protein [Burkholderiales bacterium]|nr:DUF2877 domain-containing protein [Burkholderiales bacterium]